MQHCSHSVWSSLYKALDVQLVWKLFYDCALFFLHAQLWLGEAVAVSVIKFTVFGMTEQISEIQLNSVRKSEPTKIDSSEMKLICNFYSLQ